MISRLHEKIFSLIRDTGVQVIALLGGGGKSSLLIYMARVCKAQGLRAIFTTTTRMRFSELKNAGPIFHIQALKKGISEEKGPMPQFSLMGHKEGMKAVGISLDEVGEIAKVYPSYKIIVEADGAKGRPIKANLEHEPVVPSNTDLAIGMIGLDCLGRSMEEVAFRSKELARLSGIQESEDIDLKTILDLTNHPEGLFKNVRAGAKKILFLNKSDLLSEEEKNRLEAKLGHLRFNVDMVWIGSVKKETLKEYRPCRN